MSGSGKRRRLRGSIDQILHRYPWFSVTATSGTRDAFWALSSASRCCCSAAAFRASASPASGSSAGSAYDNAVNGRRPPAATIKVRYSARGALLNPLRLQFSVVVIATASAGVGRRLAPDSRRRLAVPAAAATLLRREQRHLRGRGPLLHLLGALGRPPSRPLQIVEVLASSPRPCTVFQFHCCVYRFSREVLCSTFAIGMEFTWTRSVHFPVQGILCAITLWT